MLPGIDDLWGFGWMQHCYTEGHPRTQTSQQQSHNPKKEQHIISRTKCYICTGKPSTTANIKLEMIGKYSITTL